jgi:phospholipid/cholesterol/gamma-HCH transport system ATP-binding protein
MRGVSKAFGAPVLDAVDLEIPDSCIYGLVGPAASGKSLLLKLACGLVRPDAGSIIVDGAELATASEDELQALRARFGMLFQNGALFDFMDVEHNVAFPLLRAGEAEDTALDRARERLKAVGLAGSERKAPSELSGGMRKRAAIARATITEAPIVLYDEPTAGLDPVTTSKIYDLLRADHARTGATVVVVSSDVDGLRAFAGEMGMLWRGRLVFSGPASAIAESDQAVVRQFVRGELEGPL